MDVHCVKTPKLHNNVQMDNHVFENKKETKRNEKFHNISVVLNFNSLRLFALL